MRIFNLKTTESDELVTLSATVESLRDGSKEIWFATQKKFSNHLCTTRMDPFVVGLLYPAMQQGVDIQVDGCISKKLLFNINNYAIPLIMAYSDTAKKITITASETTSEIITCHGVGTGFSGGVDSFGTIYDRYEKEKDPEIKINSLLFLNVGSHGWDQDTAQLKFKTRYEYLEGFPKEINLDFISLDSNLHYFHPWGHQETHTLTSAAGVLAMQNKFAKYYYSSAGLNFQDTINCASRFKGIDIGGFCDPILLPLLSTETTELILDGTPYSRTEKISNIANYEPTFRFLNVCVSGEDTHTNCSVCSKCLRTLLALDFSGRLDQYSNLFDIAKYKKKKNDYIRQQIATKHKSSFSKANIELAEKNNITLPSYFTSKVYFVLRHQLKAVAGKAVKAMFPEFSKKLKQLIHRRKVID